MTTTPQLLAGQMADAFADLTGGLEGLTDDEFFWEPVPGCWRVYRDEAGRWTYDYDIPEPVPSPFTTIGWRLVHVALCKVIYHEWAFGPRKLDFMSVENPGNVEEAIEMLELGHRLLTRDLQGLDTESLGRPVATNWGERWPAWRIFTTMIDHDRKHGAEIRVLRDLYRIGDGLGFAR